MNTLHVRGG
jgi:chromatin segregation and condensation protein Rec8/ScpA/Scc1 (kleisin family)